MRTHLSMLRVDLAASLHRDGRAGSRRRGPRRARGTFVPAVVEAPPMRLAH